MNMMNWNLCVDYIYWDIYKDSSRPESRNNKPVELLAIRESETLGCDTRTSGVL